MHTCMHTRFSAAATPAGARPSHLAPVANITPSTSSLPQVIVTSFTLIILLMLGTFNVVLNAGGVRLAGLD